MGWKTLLLTFGVLFLAAACSGSSGDGASSETNETAASTSAPASDGDAGENGGESTGSGEPLEGGRLVRIEQDTRDALEDVQHLDDLGFAVGVFEHVLGLVLVTDVPVAAG